MITTELALAIPALIIVSIMCAWFISLAILGVQLNSLSASYARVLARGDQIAPAMQAQLPPATDVKISHEGAFVDVKLTTGRRFPFPHLNKTLHVKGESVARMEVVP